MTDVHKHLVALANATRVYAEGTSLSVRFLIAENERMAKELQVAKQGGDLVKISAQAELKKEILDEVLSLTQSCGCCIPSLVPCIRQSSISLVGSNDVLEENVSYQTCMLL